jgi:hypothetical protein
VNENATDRLAFDIDPDLLKCLRMQVNSFIKWDLVHFFYQNPYTIDTPEGIARHIGRNVGVIRVDLVALAAEGLLTVHCYDGVTVYSCSTDPVVKDKVQRLVEAFSDRLFRTRAAFQVIRAMRADESSPGAATGDECGDEQRKKSFVVSS